jgi:hypothetical protein
MEDSYQLQRMGLRLDPSCRTRRLTSEPARERGQQVKAAMISNAISEAEGLKAGDADVDAEIAKMAEDPAANRWRSARGSRRRSNWIRSGSN